LAFAFTPPPNIRLALGQEEALQRDCWEVTRNEHRDGNDACQTYSFIWAPEIQACDYTLATKIFGYLAANNATSTNIWLPRLSDDSSNKRSLSRLVQVLNDNSHRLGNVAVESTLWPKTPATQVIISTKSTSSPRQSSERIEPDTAMQHSIQNTEQWVQEKLCGMGLCPYTASMTRAAVGLESVGVAEGPIVIRHSNNVVSEKDTDAVTLSLAFWKGVADLASLPEDEVATYLIIAPGSLDNDFEEFAGIFDELIEPSVQAVGAETIVGRALFHPHYNASLIGHDNVIAGHALPAAMVQGFVEQYAPSMNLEKNAMPDLDKIALANDA
ncbi:MAG: hypothetical protein SGILL_010658, partial [Bacillariaceae sp.]